MLIGTSWRVTGRVASQWLAVACFATLGGACAQKQKPDSRQGDPDQTEGRREVQGDPGKPTAAKLDPQEPGRETITLKHSQQYAEEVLEDGRYVYRPYRGKTTAVVVKVEYVQPALVNSPSISTEENVATLALNGKSGVPGRPSAKRIRFHFGHKDMSGLVFRRGEMWTIAFGEAGEFVGIHRATVGEIDAAGLGP
jgi:hypothetical protein